MIQSTFGRVAKASFKAFLGSSERGSMKNAHDFRHRQGVALNSFTERGFCKRRQKNL